MKKKYEKTKFSGLFFFKKKGQITVFIIIGIIILVVAGILFFIGSKEKEISGPEEIMDITAIKLYIEQCVILTVNDAIYENGLHGGYFLLPEHTTASLLNNVPYYLDLGQDYTPEDNDFADEIADYVETMLDLCLEDFKVFENKGFNISESKLDTNVMLVKDQLKVSLEFPLQISLGTQTREISSFEINIPVKQFYENLMTAREIVNSQENNEVCLTCFSNLAEDNNLLINILPHYGNTYVFDIKDNDYLIDGKNYRLRFAVKFNES